MVKGYLISGISHIFLIIFLAYIFPNLLASNSFLEISVDIISEEIFEPEPLPKKEQVIKPPKRKIIPKVKEEKRDDKIRQIRDIVSVARPVEKAKENIEKKKPEPKKEEINDLDNLDDKRLDDILEKIRKAEGLNREKQDLISKGVLTESEIQGIRTQVNSCWYNIYGRIFAEEDLQNIQIRIYVALDEYGNVIDVRPIEEAEKYMNLNNLLYRKIIDSAVHSFIACKKIQNLPKTKYKHWKEFEFTFQPSEIYY